MKSKCFLVGALLLGWFQVLGQTLAPGTLLNSLPVNGAPATGPDGTIYFSELHGLHAIDPYGNQKWHIFTNEWADGNLAISPGNIIYATSLDGYLNAVNPDGTVRWRTYVIGNTRSPAFGPDGTIYVGNIALYAINPDGSQKWKYMPSVNFITAPSVGADGTIYFGSEDRNLYAVGADGVQKWAYTTGDFFQGSPAIGADGTIYAASGPLFAIHPDGTKKWSFKAPASFEMEPPSIGNDGTIYSSDGSGKVYAISPSGASLWSFTTGGSLAAAPTVLANGSIVVASGDSKIYGISPSGNQLWAYNALAPSATPPAIGLDGSLYLGLMGLTEFIILSGNAPLGQTPWPASLRDSAHTGRYQDYTPTAPVIGGQPRDTVATNNASLILRVQASGIPASSYQWRFGGNPIGNATNALYYNAVVQLSDAGPYDVIVSNSGGSVTSAPAVVTIVAPGPVFTQQPTSQLVPLGGTGTLSVDSTGAQPIGYQWYFANQPLVGATSKTLSISNFSATNTGNYFAVASNLGGTATSAPAQLTLIAPGVALWKLPLPFGVASEPAVSTGGILYFGGASGDPTFYEATADGQIVHTLALTSPVGGSPAIGPDGTIYFGQTDGHLVAVDANLGKLWNYSAQAPLLASPAVDHDGTVYFGSTNGLFYAMTQRGILKWKTNVVSGVQSSPAIGNGSVIYFGGLDGKFHALGTNGIQKWTYPVGAKILSSPAIGGDGTLYFGAGDSNIYALDSNGSKKWATATGGAIGTASPVIGEDGSIYCGSSDGKVYALNPDGVIRWTYDTGGDFHLTPATTATGFLYVAGHDGLSALDSNGGLRWHYPASGASSRTSPQVLADRSILYGAGDSTLTLIDGDGDLAKSGWPTFHQNRQLTGRAVVLPDVVLNSPTNGQQFSIFESIVIQASAYSPNGPITNVEFYAGTTLLGSRTVPSGGTNSPYELDWIPSTPGTVAIVAKAYDTANAQATSATVTIVIVGSNTPPTLVLNPQSVTSTNNASVTLTVAAQGTLPLAFHWYKNGVPLTGASSSDLFLDRLSLDDSARYFAVVTNVAGSITSTVATLTVLQSPKFLWTQGVGMMQSSPAIGMDGTIYAPGSGLHALRDDGTYLWNYYAGLPPFSASIASAPVVAPSGDIYFGATSGKYYSIGASGAKIWETQLTNYLDSSAVLGADGTIYTANESGQFYAMNSDGQIQWILPLGAATYSSPAMGTNGMIYVGVGTNMVAISSGHTIAWKFPTGDRILSSPAIGSDETVYFGSSDGNLYAITSTGTKLWALATGGPVESSPAIGVDGTVFVGTVGPKIANSTRSNGKLLAVNPDGTIKWVFSTPNGVRSAPALASDGTVYFGNEDGVFFAVNWEGIEKWEYVQGFRPFMGGITIGPDGLVFSGPLQENVLVFDGGSPPARSPWPMFRREYRHRGRASSGTPPIVQTIVPPAPATFYSAGPILISATVVETDEPIEQVDLLVDGTAVGSRMWSPYVTTWNTPTPGLHYLSARAIDRMGVPTTSAPVAITVLAATGPTLVLTNPLTGQAFLSGDSIPLAIATGSNAPVLSKVEYYAGTLLIASSSTAPFTAAWSNAPAGAYFLSAHAYDTASNLYTSLSLDINVTPRPTVRITSPTNGTVLQAGTAILVAADVSSSVGSVSRVEFNAGSQQIAVLTNAPFRTFWTNTASGPYQLSALTVDSAGHTNVSAPSTVWLFNYGTQTADFVNFQTDAGLLLQGDAIVSSNHLSLTSSSSNSVGAAWIDISAYIGGGFQCDFEFQITDRTGEGGAGLAFVIQGNTLPVLGEGGSGMGYQGIPKSLAIEFDSHQDVFEQDPNPHHICFITRNLLPNNADHSFGTNPTIGGPDFTDGSRHRVHINYKPGYFEGLNYLAGELTLIEEPDTSPAVAVIYDIGPSLGLTNSQAWIGITAANGPGTETHDILNWKFTAPGAPPFISAPPQSQTFTAGTSSSLSVAASGLAPLQYQWHFNNNDIPGATNSVLPLDNLQITNTGDYAVTVSNPAGSLLSQAAHIIVTQFGSVRWTYKGRGPAACLPAIDSDGSLYFSTYGTAGLPDYFVGIDATGREKWALTQFGPVRGAPAISARHTLYAGFLTDYSLHAFSTNGQELWSFPCRGVTASPAVGADETIYFGAGDNHLYALLPDGMKKWDFTTGGYLESAPAIGVDGTVYFGSADNHVYALNPDGSMKWIFNTGGEVHSPPTIGSDGTIYISSYDGKLYAIDPSGSQKWTSTAASNWSAVVAFDGTLYVTRGANLIAVAATGNTLWTYTAGAFFSSSPVLASDGKIYAGTENGLLYAFNADGTQAWKTVAGSKVTPTGATVGSDGTIYVGTQDAGLVAFWGNAAAPGTGWPMFHRDLSRTGRIPPVGPPIITLQPESHTLGAGTNLVLIMTAIGSSPLAFQWLKDSIPLQDADNVSGAQTAILTLNGPRIEQSGNYTVIVTNYLGKATSQPATVTILPTYEPPGSIVWTYHLSSQILTTPAVGSDGTLYFSAQDNKIYAVDPTGKLRWTYSTGTRTSPTVVAPDGTIYFSADQPTNRFVALRPNGTRKWDLPLSVNTLSTPAVGYDGAIYVAAGDGALHALDSNGNTLWSTPLGEHFDESAPSVAPNGMIFIGAGHEDPILGYTVGDCVALYPDGTEAWKFSARGPFTAAPAIAADGTVYFASASDGIVYAFDRFGTLRWKYKVGTAFFSGPVVDATGAVYASTYDGSLFVINADGTKKWLGAGSVAAALAADGTTYSVGADGTLRGYSAVGVQKWSTDINTWGISIPPTLTAGGMIYAARGDILAAVQASAGLAGTGWPMAYLNPEHTGNLQSVAIPIVTITSPTNGTHVLEGASITLAAEIPVTAAGFSDLAYYADGRMIGSITNRPYTVVWTNAGGGTHQISAVVTGNGGVTNSSQLINITVNNPPSVGLTAPVPGAIFYVEDDIILAASATDGDGTIARVEFYQGTQLLGTATQAPYSWRLLRAAAGNYTFKAIAYDNFGDSTVSNPLTVRVDAAPKITLSAPGNNSSAAAGRPLNLVAQVSDIDGTVSRVEFFDGSDLVGVRQGSPFSIYFTPTIPGTHTFYARAIDNLGLATRSLAVTVTITSSNLPPQLSFLSPFDHSTIPAGLAVPVVASSTAAANPIASFELLAGGTVLATQSQGGTLRWDWTNAIPGSAIFTARTVDSLGLTNSRTIHLTILPPGDSLPDVPTPAVTNRPNLWTPDGAIYAMAELNGVLYIGGSFTHIGQNVPGNSTVAISAASPDLSYPGVDLLVDTLIDDGAGGYYVGGYFNSIGGVPRRNLAHVTDGKRVDLDFRADTDGHVLALALSNGTLYVGGEFRTIGGKPQRYLAALDPKSGALSAWNPAPTDWVSAIAVSNLVVYIGGNFQYAGGEYRNHIAAISADGTATSWNPGADGWIGQMLITGGKLYAAGAFGRIADAPRPGFAAFDLATGGLDGLSPSGITGAQCLAYDGGILYVGGDSSAVGIDLASGSTIFSANVSGSVSGIAAVGNDVYLDGDFSQINGIPRNRVGSVSRSTGLVSGLDLNPSGRFTVMGKSGTNVLAAGAIGLVEVPRAGLAAIDEATGFATSWNPGCDGTVYALTAAGGNLYIGGQFQNLGGQARSSLAAVSLATGEPTPWRPTAANVRTLALANDTIFIGGYFNQVGGLTRNNLAELDLRTGDPSPWNPAPNGGVLAIQFYGDAIYFGGEFTSVGGQIRHYLAAVNRYSGVLSKWNPNADGIATSLASSSNFIYAGGAFTKLGGDLHSHLAAIDAETGSNAPWFPQTSGSVLALQSTSNILYVVGQFDQIGKSNRFNLAAIDQRYFPPVPLDWNPQPGTESSSAEVVSLLVTDSTAFAGGRFQTVAGTPAPYLAGFDLPIRIENPVHLPSGLFQFNFFGPLGHYYVFETSTNLLNWMSILTNKAPFLFEDIESLNQPQLFYRAVPLQ